MHTKFLRTVIFSYVICGCNLQSVMWPVENHMYIWWIYRWNDNNAVTYSNKKFLSLITDILMITQHTDNLTFSNPCLCDIGISMIMISTISQLSGDSFCRIQHWFLSITDLSHCCSVCVCVCVCVGMGDSKAFKWVKGYCKNTVYSIACCHVCIIPCHTYLCIMFLQSPLAP